MRPSIRYRLIVLLSGAVVTIGAAQAWLCYRGSLAEANIYYDRQMQVLADAVAATVGIHGAQIDPTSLHPPGASGFNVMIYPTSAGAAGLPTAFSTQSNDGNGIRVYRVISNGATIEITQPVNVRSSMARSMAIGTTWPIFALAPVLLLAVWIIVGHAVAPVRVASRLLAGRQARELAPLDDSRIPDEIAPLVVELNRLFARVQDLLEARERFIADAAHELRSPLAGLKLQIQAFALTPGGASPGEARGRDERWTAKLGRLDEGVERLQRLVEQLLTLARTEGGDTTAHTVALGSVTRQIVDEFIDRAAMRGVRVDLEIGFESEIPGPRAAVHVLVANLLDNAIKYTAPGTQVLVSICDEVAGPVLTVEDAGSGIAPIDRERVFDRFYRVPGTDGVGSGLGLSIVRAAATGMGARVSLADSRLGGLAVRVHFVAMDDRAGHGAVVTN